MAEFCQPFSQRTCGTYRYIVRGFLSYLHRQRGILKKDLAPLLIAAPQFVKAKPPKFLRPHEVQQLSDSLSISSAKDLRTYVMLHLVIPWGCEICRIALDDIAFKKAQLNVEDRKNKQPLTLPIACETEATLNAARAIQMDHQVGSLEPGKLADFVVLTANPLNDISVLAEKNNIEAVYKGGDLVC